MKEELSNTTAASEFKAYREAVEAKLAAALAREKVLRDAAELLEERVYMCLRGVAEYCELRGLAHGVREALDSPAPRVYTAEELQPFLDLAKGIDTYLKDAAYYELDEHAGEVIAHARDIGLLDDERKEDAK